MLSMDVPTSSPIEPTTPFSQAAIAAFAANVKAQCAERGEEIQSEPHEKEEPPDIPEEDTLNAGSEFLRFIPDNEAAQLAFHELACKKQSGDLNLNHVQFIFIRGKCRLTDEAGHDYGWSGDGTSAESFDEQGLE